VTERLHCGLIATSIADVIDAVDLLPNFEMAAIPVLEGTDRPGEYPEIRRRLRGKGIRTATHRGVLLITPGDLDRFPSVGLNHYSELFLCPEWNDELEPFPGRVTTDVCDFGESAPLGLEEWMVDSGCLLALGDGPEGLNFGTLDPALAERMRERFPAPKARR
jgi:hypothetical protein